MCLSKVDLALKFVDGEWVGEGYKVVRTNLVSQYNNFQYKEQVWLKAKEDDDSIKTVDFSGRYGYINYPSGFHSFLNLEDAKKYKNATTGVNGRLFKVYYKTVLAFGLNEIEYNPDDEKVIANWSQGPCVVSLYVKLVEEIDKKLQIDPENVLQLYLKYGKLPRRGGSMNIDGTKLCPLSILYLDHLKGVMFTDREAPYKHAEQLYGREFMQSFWHGFDSACSPYSYSPQDTDGWKNGVAVAELLKKHYNLVG